MTHPTLRERMAGRSDEDKAEALLRAIRVRAMAAHLAAIIGAAHRRTTTPTKPPKPQRWV